MKVWTAIAAALKTATELTLMFAGIISVAYGAWLAYPPAGFITGGMLLLGALLLHARGASA